MIDDLNVKAKKSLKNGSENIKNSDYESMDSDAFDDTINESNQPTNQLPIARIKRWLSKHAKYRNLRVEKQFWYEFEAITRQQMTQMFQEVCDFQKEFLPKRGTLMKKSLLQYLKYKYGINRDTQEEDPFNAV